MATATENQFLGALLGMAIGDALGAPVSGLSRAEIVARFGVIDRYRDSALPDATETAPGAFTDETEIALCIAESMTTSGGALDPETAGFRMVRLALGDSRSWLRPDTLAALDRAAESLEFVVPLQEDGPATGDVASRGVPIGLIHAVGRFDADALRRESEAAARLTHGAPAAFNAVTAVAYGVRLAATGAPRDSWLLETADFLGGGELAARLRAVAAALGPERSLSDLLEEIGAGLDALQAVPAAFAIAAREPVFEDAVFAAVNAAGAADTIGALTGALAGAANGASGIPQPLIDGLEGRIYISLAAPWLYKAARQRAGQLIDLRPVHGPRPDMPPRQ